MAIAMPGMAGCLMAARASGDKLSGDKVSGDKL